MYAAILLLVITGFYIALYAAVWGTLSFFMPPDVSVPVAAVVLVLGTVIVFWRWSAASVLLGRSVVAHQYRTWIHRLEPACSPACTVVPVRLAGVGSRKDRFDVSLINSEPDSIIGGVRAEEFSVARDRSLYLVSNPHDLQLWTRHRLLRFYPVLAFDLDQVENVKFIEHNPDRLPLRNDHARRYVGSLDIVCLSRRHVFLYVRFKPRFADQK